MGPVGTGDWGLGLGLDNILNHTRRVHAASCSVESDDLVTTPRINNIDNFRITLRLSSGRSVTNMDRLLKPSRAAPSINGKS